jgi:hypothetical protein
LSQAEREPTADGVGSSRGYEACVSRRTSSAERSGEIIRLEKLELIEVDGSRGDEKGELRQGLRPVAVTPALATGEEFALSAPGTDDLIPDAENCPLRVQRGKLQRERPVLCGVIEEQ